MIIDLERDSTYMLEMRNNRYEVTTPSITVACCELSRVVGEEGGLGTGGRNSGGIEKLNDTVGGPGSLV